MKELRKLFNFPIHTHGKVNEEDKKVIMDLNNDFKSFVNLKRGKYE